MNNISIMLPKNLLSQIPGRREINDIVSFESPRDFEAIRNAEQFLQNSDSKMTIGSMCGDEPIGFSNEVEYIAKWRNIDYKDRARCQGVILSDDFRNGPVYVVYFK